MPINSKSKGKRGELLWRDQLIANGFCARRGQQFAGGTDSPDVICDDLDHIHFEVKNVEALNIWAATDQAYADANGKKVPVVAFKRNRSDWFIAMRADDWFKMLRSGLKVS